MRLKHCLVILSSIVILSACKKSVPAERDILGSITITSPSSLGIYLNGTNLRIQGEASDLNLLTSVRVEVRNKSTNAILFQASSNTGNVDNFAFLWNWTISGVTAPITATVKVFAVDKLSNEITKEIDISLSV